MLARIALAVDLPVPTEVGWHDDILSLSFARVSDGHAWATYLDPKAEIRPHTDKDGTRYLGQRDNIVWQGWQVNLIAYERFAPDDDVLTSEQKTALTALDEDTQ